MQRRPIYVEIAIDAPLEAVWHASQDPRVHREWDLRFSAIEYLPKSEPDEPQRFRYATRMGLGLWIEGAGESAGALEKNGERTSALRFWSDDRKSLIREGSGYWKYIPSGSGTRFLTRYDYSTRFGAVGALFDRLVFRPAMGWATAWSFDCLRIALESGAPARQLVASSVARAVARATLVLVWIYQGVVPKLLFPESGELETLEASGFLPGRERAVLYAIGVAEILFGLLLAARPRSTALLWVMLAALVLLLISAAFAQRELLIAPFSAPVLTLAVAGLAAVELVLARAELPSASRCKREP